MEKDRIIQLLENKIDEWKQTNIQSESVNHYEDETMEFGVRQGREYCIFDLEEMLNKIQDM
jgi:hypothetical protein